MEEWAGCKSLAVENWCCICFLFKVNKSDARRGGDELESLSYLIAKLY